MDGHYQRVATVNATSTPLRQAAPAQDVWLSALPFFASSSPLSITAEPPGCRRSSYVKYIAQTTL